jgi:PAS domain S-box-containing protein
MNFEASRFAGVLLGSTPDAVIYADAQGSIRYWNPGAERIFGYPGAEAIDMVAPAEGRPTIYTRRDGTPYEDIKRRGP